MSVKEVTTRAIIGTFFEQLRLSQERSWINRVLMTFKSDQDQEIIKWLGSSPAMKKWVGNRNPASLKDNGITILNELFEASIEYWAKDRRRDRFGQLAKRVQELAIRAQNHWDKLVGDLIVAGEATNCYDGQNFFDTDHSEGSSGTQDNDLGASMAGSAPTAAEMVTAISGAINAILGYKDDQGEPMNDDARAFVVRVPSTYYMTAVAALRSEIIVDTASKSNPIKQSGLSIDLWPSARAESSKIQVFRTDGVVKPFVAIDEYGIKVKAKGEGSEYEFDTAKNVFGVDANRGVGYGYWQHACLVTFS